MPLYVIALLVLLVAAPSAGAAPRAELAFVHDGRIWSMRADGSERHPLPLPSHLDGHRLAFYAAAWSPDGAQLAVGAATGRQGRGRILLVAPDGSRLRRLTRHPRADEFDPAFAPDGRRVAFARSRFTNTFAFTDIAVTDVANGATKVIVHQPLRADQRFVGTPVWSPDGRSIAYTVDRLERGGVFRPSVWTVRPDGSGRRRLIEDAQQPAWSPDGTRIAVSSVRDRHGTHREGSDEDGYDGEIYVTEADGGTPRRLTTTIGNDLQPTWSPDGTRIAFSSDHNFPGAFGGDNLEVETVAVDGSCPTLVTNGTPASDGPVWRPGASADPSPGACGEVPEATVDVPTDAAARVRGPGPFWLGPRFGDGLLSSFSADGDDAFFEYGDCALSSPKGCPEPVVVDTGDICASPNRSRLEDVFAQATSLTRERGAMVASFNGTENVQLYTGGSEAGVQLDGDVSESRRPRAGAILPFLRRYGDPAPGPLAAPALPGRFLRALERTARIQAGTGDTHATARELHLPLERVRERLAVRRALRRFGHVDAAPC